MHIDRLPQHNGALRWVVLLAVDIDLLGQCKVLPDSDSDRKRRVANSSVKLHGHTVALWAEVREAQRLASSSLGRYCPLCCPKEEGAMTISQMG